MNRVSEPAAMKTDVCEYVTRREAAFGIKLKLQGLSVMGDHPSKFGSERLNGWKERSSRQTDEQAGQPSWKAPGAFLFMQIYQNEQ